MEKDTKKLFQITEAAHACGLSRSTLMRMEKKGLLTPAYIAAESGRRYYDNHDVARILQIEKFKSMGLTTEQIADYFAQGGEISTLLATLESRLQEIQRSVEELRLRTMEAPGISVQIMRQPAVTCRMRECMGRTVADKYADMYDFYSECVRQGCVLSEEPLFTISDRQDYLEGISAVSHILILSVFPCNRKKHLRMRWYYRNVVCYRCCTAVIIPVWMRRG